MGAQDVLERVRSVLKIVNEAGDDWHDVSQWAGRLPPWFVSACSPAMTREQVQEWVDRLRALPHDEQLKMQGEAAWTIDNWLYWMVPGNRHWWWWNASLLERDRMMVEVLTVETPFPWGSLRWLFRAAGASDLIEAPALENPL
jgi:hypothetical protein